MNSTPAAGRTGLPWPLAWRLALGQIEAWGILYYAFTVVVGPMQAATGWSKPFLNAGVSIGLLVWGLLALPVGAWIQRRGGRGIMAAASALGGLALGLMGMAADRFTYVAAWVLLGAAMAGLLYDSAFAVVTRAFGAEYRRGITLITLVGGLASTVFIPLAQTMVDSLGWREALFALGGFQVALGVPLHWCGIPRWDRQPGAVVPAPASARWSDWWTEFLRDTSDRRFVGLALWFTAHAAAFTGLIFQLVSLLQAMGVANQTILQVFAVFGPLQVLGRFLLSFHGGGFSTLRVGRWAMGALITGLLILLLLPPKLGWLIGFAALFGLGNGVTTILRGTAIAEIFGRDRYAELNGALSAPGVVAKAAAPLALAGLWTATGDPKSVFGALLGVLGIGCAGLALTSVAQRRRPQAIVPSPVEQIN
jgi:MFS family permease